MLGKRKWRMTLAAVAATAALVIALPGSALAIGGGSNGAGIGASWNVPTTPMTNTVEKDGKDYKVVTTWAMAWSTSGPDFLGINNSSFYGNGGNGNANVTNTTIGATQTLVGVWASDANEQPNAFNWNSFYNLYAQEQTAGGNVLEQTDLACTTDSWDTSSGVWGPFKYRPEIIWLCNNLNADQTATYVGYINNGQYLTNRTVEEITIDQYNALSDEEKAEYQPVTSGRPPTVVGYQKVSETFAADAEEGANYYVEGDETYTPFVIQPVNSSPYSFVDSAYELAGYVDQVIANTADAPGLAEGEELNWKTMNKLPRATRYAESADDCALNIERLARGSALYTLSKIAAGDVARKKVAFVDSVPSEADATHVTVRVYDYIEDIGGNGGQNGATMHGRASWTPLVVDQLGADQADGLDVVPSGDHVVISGGVGTDPNTSVARPTMTTTTYKASADDLLKADIIYAARQSYTVDQWRSFLATATGENKDKADTIEIIAGTPYVANGSNYTMDKMVYGAFALDCFYPELFPNMENCAFWYNKVYHIKNAMLGSAMTWAFGDTATMPSQQQLPSVEEAASYDASATIAKYDAGLAYYNANSATDPTISRILSNTALDGTTAAGETAYNYTSFEPSAYWQEALSGNAESEAAVSNAVALIQAIPATIASDEDAAKVAAAQAAYDALSAEQKAKVDAKLGASAASMLAAAQQSAQAYQASKNKKKANPITVKAKTVKAKAKKKTTVKAAKVATVSNAQGAVTWKKLSGHKKISVAKNGKMTVKKGLKKKKTYKVKIQVSAAGNDRYEPGSKTVTVKVKIK